MRYFFHRTDGVKDPDHEGLELSGEDDARYEAVLFAIDTLKDRRYALWQGGEFRIEVMDSDRTPIFVVVISTTRSAVAQSRPDDR